MYVFIYLQLMFYDIEDIILLQEVCTWTVHLNIL